MLQGRFSDFRSKIILFLVRWRAQQPGWRIETMGRLVTSEVEGVRMIEQVLPKVTDAAIRTLLEKHLEDEKRHASLFAKRYSALLIESGQPLAPPPNVSQYLQEFNILTLIAYLETQESRAISLLKLYCELYEGDDETVDIIARNLKDEKFHASWTHKQLEKWIKEGKEDEVKRARKMAYAADRYAFWLQLFAFLKVMPKLIMKGSFPPVFNKLPSPI